MKILWITPSIPYPVEDGAKKATEALVQTLSKQGVSLHLVTSDPREINTAEQSEIIKYLGLTSLSYVRGKKRPFLRAAVQPLTPLTMLRFTTQPFRKLLESKRQEGGWDAVVYDGLHPAAHAIHHGSYRSFWGQVPTIYRAHNVESEIWRGRSHQAVSFVEKIIFTFQTLLVRKFERSVLSSVAHVATVSDSDAALLQAAKTQTKVSTVPIGFSFHSSVLNYSQKNEQLLFVGRIDWKPNSEGLVWFLRHVWPEVKKHRPQISMVIVGSGDATSLASDLNQEGVVFAGRVDDVTPYYAESQLSLVPIFYGSGTRVKVIESVANGCPVLSTPLGVEGLEMEKGSDFLCESDVQGWVEAIVSFDDQKGKELAVNAYRSLEKKWGCEESSRRFVDILKSENGTAQ
ncbi:MAG: glycosyltransferase [Bdellovibrionales bacterium]|nr:glycosyltransferase [Bdellovibrionales bacterium]